MRLLAISLLFAGSCILGCCSSERAQETVPPKDKELTHGQPTVQRYNVMTIAAIIESIAVVDTASYRLYARMVSTISQGEESITPGQVIELLPRYIYTTQSLIDWSIEINRKLRALRDMHPGTPLQGSVMIDERQRWLLLGVE